MKTGCAICIVMPIPCGLSNVMLRLIGRTSERKQTCCGPWRVKTGIVLFKIQHGLVDISPEFVQPGDSHTRGSQRIRQLEAHKDVYRYSFYPRTISDWNWLPISVTNSQTILGLREAQACLPPTLHLH